MIDNAVVTTERDLAWIAIQLGAEHTGGPLAKRESDLLAGARSAPPALIKTQLAEIRRKIRAGGDPLGGALCQIRTPLQRRSKGAFYTPTPLVEAMTGWVATQRPQHIVDCGAGTGRFSIDSARIAGVQSVIAVEIDPLACLILRANAGCSD